jgi:hypothetical protein
LTDSVVTIGPVNVENVSTFIVDIQEVNADLDTLVQFMLSDRLQSVEWGATRGPFDYIKKASVVQNTDAVTGNSNTWTISNTAQEIVRWPMFADEWTDSGTLMFDVSGTYLCSAGASYSIYIDVQACDVPRATDDISSANFGLLESWTTVYSYLSPTISLSGGSTSKPWIAYGRFVMQGHTGTSWSQLAHIEFGRGSQISSSPSNDATTHGISTSAIDPSKDQWLRIVVYTSVALTPGSREVTVYSSSVGIRNGRDGYNAIT